MAKASVPHFHNNIGVPTISIGVKQFMCVGAINPYDHPHIYLDMGREREKICPYCSTLFKLDEKLASDETIPSDCLLGVEAS
ncbi:MAG: zinc-finger domain-containing protein [Rhizobiaceae bacterium]